MAALHEGGAAPPPHPPNATTLSPSTALTSSPSSNPTADILHPPQHPERGTYVNALTGPPLQIQTHKLNLANLPRPVKTTYKGKTAIIFPDELVDEYAKPFKYALVGKYSQGRPPLDLIRNFFKSIDLKKDLTVGLLDKRHILLNFCDESDYLRVYSRTHWFISGYPMRVFKWTVDFHVNRESSIVPIWFQLPNLPLQYQNDDAIFTIGNTFGQALRLDTATVQAKRPNLSCVQVEIDLLKDLPDTIWLQKGTNQGIWQEILPDEDIPNYCGFCWHLGHKEVDCLIKYPHTQTGPLQTHKGRSTKQIYQPKAADGEHTIVPEKNTEDIADVLDLQQKKQDIAEGKKPIQEEASDEPATFSPTEHTPLLNTPTTHLISVNEQNIPASHISPVNLLSPSLSLQVSPDGGNADQDTEGTAHTRAIKETKEVVAGDLAQELGDGNNQSNQVLDTLSESEMDTLRKNKLLQAKHVLEQLSSASSLDNSISEHPQEASPHPEFQQVLHNFKEFSAGLTETLAKGKNQNLEQTTEPLDTTVDRDGFQKVHKKTNKTRARSQQVKPSIATRSQNPEKKKTFL